MITMTTQAEALKGVGISKEQFNKWAREVLLSLQSSNLSRVHNRGEDINGTSIGSYGTKPLYINPKNSPVKFKPAGKGVTKTRNKKVFHYYTETSEEGYITKESVNYQTRTGSNFKNGHPRHTRYFPDGYKGFRSKIGRETSVVNLQLSGKLKNDFRIESTANEWSLGFVTEYGEKLHEGLEKKYGKTIWGISSDDDRMIDAITDRYLNQLNAKS